MTDIAGQAERLRGATSTEELSGVFGAIVGELGFRYHALVHHVDHAQASARFIFVQNYPPDWVELYARTGLHRRDPARRLAAHRPGSFAWQDLPRLATLSRSELAMMERAREAGLAEGFTVPLHAPGQRAASCSFATSVDEPWPDGALLAAELLSHIAFAAFFDLRHPGCQVPTAQLTARQEECVVLMAQGKSDWEIGAILGLSEETVTFHLNAARARFGVSRRTQLALAAASHGIIGLDEIASWQVPPKGS